MSVPDLTGRVYTVLHRYLAGFQGQLRIRTELRVWEGRITVWGEGEGRVGR